MAITLPRRGQGPGQRAPRTATPTAADVPTAGAAHDPGLRVSPNAFGADASAAMQETGTNIVQVSDALAKAGERIRTREDTVARARAISGFTSAGQNEFLRQQTEGDLASGEFPAQYGSYLDQQMNSALSAHQGSPESRATLAARLEGIRGQLADRAAAAHVTAQRKVVSDHLGAQFRDLNAKVLADPASLESNILALDGVIDDMQPALSGHEETAYRETGRAQLAQSAVSAYLDRGAWREAADLLSTPGLAQMMTPEQQRATEARIAGYAQKDLEARTAGQAKLLAAEQILGRGLTAEERVNLAGVGTEKTPYGKIQGMEAALGRPLTEAEKQRALGIDEKMTTAQQNYLFSVSQGFSGTFPEYVAMTRATIEKTPTGYERTATGELRAIPGGPADPEAKAYAKRLEKFPQARNQIIRLQNQNAIVIGHIDKALSLVSGWSAGYGSLLSFLPNSSARQLENELETIKANVGLDTLTQLRESSPTGGALGQQSDMENRLTQAVNGALDPAQQNQLVDNLKIIRDLYPRVLADRRAAFLADYGDMAKESGALSPTPPPPAGVIRYNLDGTPVEAPK